MKKILFIASLVVVYQSVCMSQIDTIGRFPYFFYYNWPELGAAHDGMPCTYYSWRNPDLPQSGRDYLDSVGGNPCELAIFQHTDDTIFAVGMSFAYPTAYQDSFKIILYDSAMNEMISENGVSTTLTGTIPFDIPGLFDPNYLHYNIYMHYLFFKDTTIRLIGDFYIGLDNVDNSFWHCRQIPPPVYLAEWHDAPYNLHTTYRLNIDGIWHDTLSTNWAPLIFVIQKFPCEPLDSVSLVAGAGGCLHVDWDKPDLQSLWTVSLTLPDGNEIVQQTDTNHWEYCGLAPGAYYRVKVRSRCDDIDGHSWSDWSREFSIGNQAISETALPTLDVHPNPTDGTVRIDAEGIKEVWCVAADGRRTRIKVKDSQVSLKDYPAGLYVLEIQTDEGLYTAKVVRK